MQTKTKIVLATGLLAVQLFVIPALALADPSAPVVPPATPTTAANPCTDGVGGVECPKAFDKTTGPDYFVGLINLVANWMFTILLVVAVVFIVWAAYSYLTSSGDSEKVSAAHKALLYAAVAVAVGVLARGFVYIVRNTVEATNTPQSYYANGTGATGTNGNGTQPNGTNPNNQQPASPTFSPITSFTAFDVKIEICWDNQIPAIQITDDHTPPTSWSNYITTTNGDPGNPNIYAGATIPGNPPLTAVANAGQFAPVASYNTALFGLGWLGLGTTYSFSAEICNNGRQPAILLKQTSEDSTKWRQL